MFLHVLADTLGSVFVIISSVIVSWTGWTRADPLCSLVLSGLIVASTWPLLRKAVLTLMSATPDAVYRKLPEAYERVSLW